MDASPILPVEDNPAESAGRQRDEAISGIAHDLRQPVTVLKLGLQVLQRQLRLEGEVPPDRLERSLATLLETTTKIVRQLDELVDLSQPHQALVLRVEDVDLVALARRVVGEQQQISAHHRIGVEAHGLSELHVMGDAGRLERVLTNLVANAVKYSPDGGDIVLTVRQDRTALETWAVVDVTDQGMGIPVADLSHIFDRFYRASNAASRTMGTGLGLTNARQILAQHGGTIDVVSTEGHGATFTIRLPVPVNPTRARAPA